MAMSSLDPRGLDPLPGTRLCRLCGAATRFSHTAYLRAGESVALHVCTSCGAAYRGGVRGADRTDQPRREGRGGRERRRPPVDDGPPANPVLDEATARLLRETLEDG
jgi:hypothetical protein